MVNKIPDGSSVTILVSAFLEDGTIVEKGEKYDFIVGQCEVLPFIEEQVKKMQENSELTFTVSEPFGETDHALVSEIPLSQIDPALHPKPGMHLQIGESLPIIVTVTQVFKDKIVVDANHPLAGKTVHYKIKLLKVKNPH